jgi:hypothetical protein
MSNKVEIPTIEVVKHKDLGVFPLILNYTLLKHPNGYESDFKIGIYPLKLGICVGVNTFRIRIVLFKLAFTVGVTFEG